MGGRRPERHLSSPRDWVRHHNGLNESFSLPGRSCLRIERYGWQHPCSLMKQTWKMCGNLDKAGLQNRLQSEESWEPEDMEPLLKKDGFTFQHFCL